MDDGGGLENRFRESERGFESHPLRQRSDILHTGLCNKNIIALHKYIIRNYYKKMLKNPVKNTTIQI